jgi:general secretion pathway protein I
LSRSTQPDGRAGFTIIEVLIALAIVAISLSSIGMLIATTVRGTRSIERQVAELETLRSILAALPDRDQLAMGSFAGERADHRWRIDVLPFAAGDLDAQGATSWVPQSVVVTVQSPGGGAIEVDTVRLRRRTGR